MKLILYPAVVSCESFEAFCNLAGLKVFVVNELNLFPGPLAPYLAHSFLRYT